MPDEFNDTDIMQQLTEISRDLAWAFNDTGDVWPHIDMAREGVSRLYEQVQARAQAPKVNLSEMEQALSQLQHLASTPGGLGNTKLVHQILTEVGYEPKHALNNSITRADRLELALKDIGHMLDDELGKSHSISPKAIKERQAIVGAALKPKVEEKNQHSVEQTETVQHSRGMTR